jgi:hypothetical protein
MALKLHALMATLAVAAFATSPAWAQDNALQVQETNGISYVSGGIGEDEKEQLESTQANYNLRVVNADKTGHFYDGTRITIRNAQRIPVLDTASGPLFYAKLPKGRYTVEGFAGEQSKKQVIHIVDGKTSHVRFIWPEDSAE